MRLHLLAIPHTVTRSDFSHCAFTGKVQRFAPMLRAQGYDVIHYGVEGATSGATEDVTVLDTATHLALLGLPAYHHAASQFVGDYAKVDAPVYQQFNAAARTALLERLAPGDAVCLPFSFAHNAAWQGLPLIESGAVRVIETGIGYPEPLAPYRVYESDAWRHWMMSKEGRNVVAWDSPLREWVVPNYYDVAEWPAGAWHSTRVVYFGRLNDLKGCALLPFLARERPDLEFVLCGQGDPSPYCTEPNIHYQPPLHGADRAAFLGTARASLHPSRFVEPFCGAAVEAMLCGTPVVTSDFGAFRETVIDGVTGVRCGSRVRAWADALDQVAVMDRGEIRARTIARYSMEAVGPQYAAIFHDLRTM